MDDYSIMEYYIIYGVNPDEYVDVSIYVLNFSHLLLRKLNECGFKTIKNILFAKRSDLQHIRGFGIKQVEIFETELKKFFEGSNEYLKTNLATSFDEIEKSEKKYYQVFNVDPDEFIDKDISILPITPGIRMRLAQNGYGTINALLNSKRSELQRVKGVGEKQLDKIEKDLKSVVSLSMEDYKRTVSASNVNVIIENRHKILSGDFSFSHDLDADIIPIIEKYEEAYESLGSEIVSEIIEKPIVYYNLTKIIDNISKKDSAYNAALKRVEQSLELVPNDYIVKPAYSFIRAALSKDDATTLLKMGDMKSIKLGSLSYILNYGMKKEAELIAQVLKNSVFDINDTLEKLFKELHKNDMQKIVLELRSKGYTLDQIGQQYQKTRERIRQIEARAKRYFDQWNANSRIMLYISAINDSKEVISPDNVLSLFGEYGKEMLYLLKTSDQKYYFYVSDVDCFVLGNRSQLDEIIAEINGFPDLINNDGIEELAKKQYYTKGIDKDVFMVAIKSVYKRSEKVYYKTSLNPSKIYLYIIEKYYPSGILLYDDDVMTDFREHIKEEFGDVSISANDRAVRARIMDNCIMCGKGKYMIKKESYMPDELLSNIISYIDNEEHSIIMINTVYSIFEDHLLLNGIDNRYFLQGVLKEELSDKYSFTRDYIFKDSNIGSFYQEIVKYIQKFDYPITKKQIIDYFPGITEIVLNFSVSDESVINYFGEYLHGSKLNLNDTEIEYLYNCVRKIVKDGTVHHSKELYELVLHDNPNLLKKAGIFYAYSLFSVVEYLFRNEFQLSRPYIAMNDVEFLKPLEIIAEWVKSQALISIKDITLYAKELKYQVYSILDLMNSYNDSHLLINAESIASFEYIGITQEIAEKVETIVTSGISGTVLISSLSCINSLPKLNIPWTEWLIYSVLLKWGKNTDLSVTNKYFYYAHPVVAPKGKLDISDVNIDELSTTGNGEFIIDDLDNIDDLIADAIDDELFEELI